MIKLAWMIVGVCTLGLAAPASSALAGFLTVSEGGSALLVGGVFLLAASAARRLQMGDPL